jgi:N6-L-threonylcarbamoyladenine synthase
MKSPLILAIDTSCDDTSAAVTQGQQVLSNIIASQTQLHSPYGGVFPTIAKQAHKENIEQTVKIALKRAGVTEAEIQAIAVTKGPGLAPALEVGISKAKELSSQYQLPLIAINHIEGHALSVLAQPKPRNAPTPQPHKTPATQTQELKTNATLTLPGQHFPTLAIIVSGGHTEFIKVTQIGEYSRLGFTIDDAAGEALDKVGRMLDLGYPAGPTMEKFAKLGNEKTHQIPLPMTDREDFNMSFSGLKTWARNKIEELETNSGLDKQGIYDFAASFQYGVFRHICYKLNKLLKSESFEEVWLGGGVAANIKLRRMIRETLEAYNKESRPQERSLSLKLFTPYSRRLCMDNAAMIGVSAYYQYLHKNFVTEIEKLDRSPRWKIDL